MLRARIVVRNGSGLNLYGQDVCLRVERAGRQHRHIHMDTSNGALTPIGKTDAAKLVMPMAVSPNKRHLYAVIRSQPVRVLSYAIDPANGKLTQKASAPLPDSMPYVSTDRTGRFLFTASYGGDKLAVSPIGENGLVEAEAIQVIPTGRNAHSILPDPTNKFVYAAVLGANQVLQFTFDGATGKLTPNQPAAVNADAGHGPRHMAFSPNSKSLYVLNELSGHVTQYAVDTGKGTLTLVGSVSSVPAEAGLVWGAPQAPVGAAPAAATPEGRKAESLGSRSPNHAQRQIPVFNGAHDQQDRSVHAGSRYGEAYLCCQLCNRDPAAWHQDRSDGPISRCLWRKVGPTIGVQDRSV